MDVMNQVRRQNNLVHRSDVEGPIQVGTQIQILKDI